MDRTPHIPYQKLPPPHLLHTWRGVLLLFGVLLLIAGLIWLVDPPSRDECSGLSYHCYYY
ncbi:MAG TPA: hypothetical protein VGE07_12270 [Herpetosiphonaceae bacterium]